MSVFLQEYRFSRNSNNLGEKRWQNLLREGGVEKEMLRTSSAINKKYASSEFLFLVSNIFVLLNIPPPGWNSVSASLAKYIQGTSKNSITFFLLIYLFFNIFFVVVVVFSFFFFLPFPFSLPLAHHIRHIIWALCVFCFIL